MGGEHYLCIHDILLKKAPCGFICNYHNGLVNHEKCIISNKDQEIWSKNVKKEIIDLILTQYYEDQELSNILGEILVCNEDKYALKFEKLTIPHYLENLQLCWSRHDSTNNQALYKLYGDIYILLCICFPNKICCDFDRNEYGFTDELEFTSSCTLLDPELKIKFEYYKIDNKNEFIVKDLYNHEDIKRLRTINGQDIYENLYDQRDQRLENLKKELKYIYDNYSYQDYKYIKKYINNLDLWK